jgi:hypothetical protein
MIKVDVGGSEEMERTLYAMQNDVVIIAKSNTVEQAIYLSICARRTFPHCHEALYDFRE